MRVGDAWDPVDDGVGQLALVEAAIKGLSMDPPTSVALATARALLGEELTYDDAMGRLKAEKARLEEAVKSKPRGARAKTPAPKPAKQDPEADAAAEEPIPSLTGPSHLKRGDKGDHITAMQRRLTELGHGVPETGEYDSVTVDAVTAFQQANGIPATGHVTPETLEFMRTPPALSYKDQNSELRGARAAQPAGPGEFGPHVEDLQGHLTAMGHDLEGDEPGEYGARTEQAVRRVQAENGFAATGSADQQTMAMIGRLRSAADVAAAAPKKGDTMGKDTQEASYDGNPSTPGSPSSMDRFPYGGINPFVGRVAVMLGTKPPNLREADPAGFQACASCVFLAGGSAGCLEYGGYPVDRDDLCDTWRTLTPEDARHAFGDYEGDVEDVEDTDEAWSEAARAAALIARRRHMKPHLTAIAKGEHIDQEHLSHYVSSGHAEIDPDGKPKLTQEGWHHLYEHMKPSEIEKHFGGSMLATAKMHRAGLRHAKRARESVEETALTAKTRDALPDSDFAVPGREYPIHDENHARLALSLVARHGTEEQKARVLAAVRKRYPNIQVQEGLAGKFAELEHPRGRAGQWVPKIHGRMDTQHYTFDAFGENEAHVERRMKKAFLKNGGDPQVAKNLNDEYGIRMEQTGLTKPGGHFVPDNDNGEDHGYGHTPEEAVRSSKKKYQQAGRSHHWYADEKTAEPIHAAMIDGSKVDMKEAGIGGSEASTRAVVGLPASSYPKQSAKYVKLPKKKRTTGVATAQAAVDLDEVSSSAYPSLDRSPKKNWVDNAGGLPSYIERIAKHLHYEKGKSIGTAIAIAVNTVKRWCAGGTVSKTSGPEGGGGVKPDTKAKACAAVAEWEAKKKATHEGEIVEGFVFDEDELAAFEESYSLYEEDFKPIPPSMNFCEKTLAEVEAAYTDWDSWVDGKPPIQDELVVFVAEALLERPATPDLSRRPVVHGGVLLVAGVPVCEASGSGGVVLEATAQEFDARLRRQNQKQVRARAARKLNGLKGGLSRGGRRGTPTADKDIAAVVSSRFAGKFAKPRTLAMDVGASSPDSSAGSVQEARAVGLAAKFEERLHPRDRSGKFRLSLGELKAGGWRLHKPHGMATGRPIKDQVRAERGMHEMVFDKGKDGKWRLTSHLLMGRHEGVTATYHGPHDASGTHVTDAELLGKLESLNASGKKSPGHPPMLSVEKQEADRAAVRAMGLKTADEIMDALEQRGWTRMQAAKAVTLIQAPEQKWVHRTFGPHGSSAKTHASFGDMMDDIQRGPSGGKKPYPGLGKFVVVQDIGGGKAVVVDGANTEDGAKAKAKKYPGTVSVHPNEPGSPPAAGTHSGQQRPALIYDEASGKTSKMKRRDSFEQILWGKKGKPSKGQKSPGVGDRVVIGSLKKGDRVVHPEHGPGVVTYTGPEAYTRTPGHAVVKFDRSEQHLGFWDTKGHTLTPKSSELTRDPTDLGGPEDATVPGWVDGMEGRARGQASPGVKTSSDALTVDQAIGGVLAQFPGLADWDVQDKGDGDFNVNVTLASGEKHSFHVDKNGDVLHLTGTGGALTEPAAPAHVHAPPSGSGGYELTGETEKIFHMDEGQVYKGADGKWYRKIKNTKMMGKKGQLAAVEIENLSDGTTKTSPAFALKTYYPLAAPAGTVLAPPAHEPGNEDGLFKDLMKSVGGDAGVGEKGASADMSDLSSIDGLHVVVTGKIPGYTRDDVHAMISAKGGHVHSSISKQVDVLIAGDNVGATKTKKAAQYGVKVLPWGSAAHLLEAELTPRLRRLLGEFALIQEGAAVEVDAARARRRVLESRLTSSERAVFLATFPLRAAESASAS